MELVPVNGTEPTPADLSAISAQLNERMSGVAADLRNGLEAEQQIINYLEGILQHHHERAKKWRKALAAIEGSEASPPKPAAKSKTKPEASHRWSISDDKLEEVYASIVKAIDANGGKPTTLTEARRANGGGGHETYRQAVDKLREQERIRVAGKTRGGGTLIALMPEAAAHAA